MKVGITGGIGCGKSTVARAFEQRGFRRLDSDRIVRERVLTDPVVIAALRARYGDGVLEQDAETRGGGDTEKSDSSLSLRPPVSASPLLQPLRIHRPTLAQRAFSNDAERIWLEELTHPLVYAAWREAFAAEPAARWVVEVPLLFEKGLENWFDFTICVACAPDQQLARLEQRGLPRVLAGQRILKQLPLARKIELSDFVLWNEGSPSFLEAQVERLAHALPAA